SRNSREADFPCGGNILFANVVIQKGAGSDNNDSIAVATEPKICAPYAGTSFTLRQSWIIFDRPAGILGTWGLKDPAPVNITGNRFVGPFKWEKFPPPESSNRFFPSRGSAGLRPREIPEIAGGATR
ncbi:MAG: hypothetical protein HOB79_09530, partial [Rhodospirillaceae bacterium]|nr:hypothetical protein [Rhodospirillaceae bacterium]